MTEDLVRWLGEQLNEDGRLAQAAAEELSGLPLGAEWRYDGHSVETTRERDLVATASQDHMGVGCGEHIAAHDPARVLREIDAKRRLLAELLPTPREPETGSQLHARCAHPAYEYRTTEGPRKQWDHADLPPCNEYGDPEPGWERNVDAGIGGWERFDYTEESYWRRRLPEGQERTPFVPQWLRLLALPYADRAGYREEWQL